MVPIKTEKFDGIYNAPKGGEGVIGGLPFWRGQYAGMKEVNSVWKLTEDERQQIANGGNILLHILGEPIPPVGLEVTDLKEVE